MIQRDHLPNGRKVIWVGNQCLQIALAEGGGHIAALRGKDVASNPLWQPPWPSLEPSAVTPEIVNEQYGGPPEGRLLASILGHSLALDLYGPPSQEEASAGAVTHGQAAVEAWAWRDIGENGIVGECDDAVSKLSFSRHIMVAGQCASVEESVDNLCSFDRPICWQQHVSFGPLFCEEGFWAAANCDHGTTHPQSFGSGASLLPNAETEWPLAPQKSGQWRDYRKPLTNGAQANDFSGYRVRTADELGYFLVGNRHLQLALFYLWPRKFFPWLGIWDERHARAEKPWYLKTSVRAFEFGASPYPETRRNLLRWPVLFDVPAYLVLPAGGSLWVRYIMGVFSGVNDRADFKLSDGRATLVSEHGKTIKHLELSEMPASSPREEMNR